MALYFKSLHSIFLMKRKIDSTTEQRHTKNYKLFWIYKSNLRQFVSEVFSVDYLAQTFRDLNLEILQGQTFKQFEKNFMLQKT